MGERSSRVPIWGPTGGHLLTLILILMVSSFRDAPLRGMGSNGAGMRSRPVKEDPARALYEEVEYLAGHDAE